MPIVTKDSSNGILFQQLIEHHLMEQHLSSSLVIYFDMLTSANSAAGNAILDDSIDIIIDDTIDYTKKWLKLMGTTIDTNLKIELMANDHIKLKKIYREANHLTGMAYNKFWNDLKDDISMMVKRPNTNKFKVPQIRAYIKHVYQLEDAIYQRWLQHK